MKNVKVFIEKSSCGFSAYMDDTPLNYNIFGEGKTVGEAIDDFHKSYAGMRSYYAKTGKDFEEIQYEFFFDTGRFLEEYGKTFGLAGLECITGLKQRQLGRYLNGQRKPSRKTIEKIQKGMETFARNLTAVRFV